jgi:hypothetical protein
MLGKQPFYVRAFFVAVVFLSIYTHTDDLPPSHTDRLQNDSEENIQTIPTIGFNVEVLQYKNIKFQVRLVVL